MDKVMFGEWKLGESGADTEKGLWANQIVTTEGKEVCVISHLTEDGAMVVARQIIIDHNSLIALTKALAEKPVVKALTKRKAK